MSNTNTFNFYSSLPTEKQKLTAGVLAAILTLASVLALPFAKMPLPEVQPFLPAFIALIFGMDFLTGFLFFRQFLVSRSLPMLFLSGTYFFSSWITIPHILTFPGVFSSTGLLGAGTQTAVWFWVAWHGGFAISLFVYLISLRTNRSKPLRQPLRLYGWSVLGFVLLLIIFLTMLFTRDHSELPVIVQKGNYHILISSGVGPAILIINFVALVGVLIIGRAKDVIHLWLIVAVLASSLDILVTLYAGERYSLGWYVARIDSLLSAGTVFSSFLLELNRLYVTLHQQHDELGDTHKRLVQSFQEIEAQSEELQAQNDEIMSYQMQQDELLNTLQVYTTSLEESHLTLEGQQKELRTLYEKVKTHEARYRTLTNFLPVGLTVLQDGKFVFLNPECLTLFGLEFFEDWINKPFLSFVSPEFHNLISERMNKILSQREITPLVEYQMVRKDECLMDVESSGTFVMYEGKPSILVVIRDITKRKTLEKQLINMNQQLEKLAHLDGLTGILNRRSFDTYLEDCVKTINRKNPVSLILFDIDYFKSYNDTYGHQCGDDVLKRVARTAEHILQRPGDRVFRYGGEEFAVLLPETNLDNAVEMAETIRKAVYALAIPHSHSKVSSVVTGSFGVTTSQNSDAIAGLNAFIGQADRALYDSKRSGRNRVNAYKD